MMMMMHHNLSIRTKMSLAFMFLNLFKANVSLSQMSWNVVPCTVFDRSIETPVSIAAAGPSDDTCPLVGRAQLTTTFVGDQLTVGGQVSAVYPNIAALRYAFFCTDAQMQRLLMLNGH